MRQTRVVSQRNPTNATMSMPTSAQNQRPDGAPSTFLRNIASAARKPAPMAKQTSASTRTPRAVTSPACLIATYVIEHDAQAELCECYGVSPQELASPFWDYYGLTTSARSEQCRRV